MRGCAALIGIAVFSLMTTVSPTAFGAMTETIWRDRAAHALPAVVVVTAEYPDTEKETPPSEKQAEQKDPAIRPMTHIRNSALRKPVYIIKDHASNPLRPTKFHIGSGSVIHPLGYVLTALHVVDGSNAITVQLVDGSVYEADIVDSDTSSDAALLKVKPLKDETLSLPYIRMAPTDALAQGDFFCAIGHPFGVLFTFVNGVIGSPAPENSFELEGHDMTRVFRVSAPTPPGLSGSTVLDIQGRAVGIIFASVGTSNFPGFAFQAKKTVALFWNRNDLPPIPCPE